jgi:hypothetical protein
VWLLLDVVLWLVVVDLDHVSMLPSAVVKRGVAIVVALEGLLAGTEQEKSISDLEKLNGRMYCRSWCRFKEAFCVNL